ncbi:MAG TPA: hypothetical protein VF450_14670, partial [Noviherbaspirillum sp.]
QAFVLHGLRIAVRQLHIMVAHCASQRIDCLRLMTRKGASTWYGVDRPHEQRYAPAESDDIAAFFLGSFPFR